MENGSFISSSLHGLGTLRAACQCGNQLFPNNTQCMICGAPVGFYPSGGELHAVTIPAGGSVWQSTHPQLATLNFRQCRHRSDASACNWLVDAAQVGQDCLSCRLTQTIPQLGIAGNGELWAKAELAKRRVIAQLLRLGFRVQSKAESPDGLAFNFMVASPTQAVMTSHQNGLITLNLREANDANREAARERMGEKYRTLVGHIRHELGHYLWQLLSRDPNWRGAFNAIFGDDRQDYASALQRHHQGGAPADWAEHFITSYASSHPWEDWAETFGHYLHIEDGLFIANALGLDPNNLQLHATPFDPAILPANVTMENRMAFLNDLQRWTRLSVVINELAEGLGHAHLSPFILNAATVRKLWEVHTSLRLMRGLTSAN